jgi:hypothetical protein
MGAFSPSQSDLALQLAQGTRQLIPTEQVAYIAYHKSAERPPPTAEGTDRYKIHAAGRKTFSVSAKLPPAQKTLGFVALSLSPDSPFGEVFFYHHGVLATERDEPLGALLVKSGALGSEALARALAAQTEQRAVPIGQILVEHRKIAPDDATRAAEQQKRRKMRIGEVLVDAGLVSAADIGRLSPSKSDAKASGSARR